MDTFENKVAVITGAASGIGLELARVLAEQGAKLVLADIEVVALEAAARELEKRTETAFQVCDVSQADSVEALADFAESRFGAIHLVCNNAGVFTGGQLWESTVDDYQWLLNVNLWGVIHGIRSFVPRLAKHGEPAYILNTASMAAITSMPYSGIYNMSKHAVLALSESLYHELSFAHPQVGVSCLCPEMFNTGIAKAERNRPSSLATINPSDSRAAAEQAIQDGVKSGKHPREVAERAVQAIRDKQFYILSDDAWRKTANTRLDDIRLGRNPSFDPPIEQD